MVQFSTRMDLLKGSEIRELLKLTAQPDIISFAGGMPAPELFPVEQMMEASRAVLEENGRAALQYSSTEGHPRLRQQIAERMLAKNNIHTDADHILVTSGSQQGLDFSARVFLNPGDVVLLESPSYLGAVNAFKACEPRFIEVPTDNGGMIMEELEKILANTPKGTKIWKNKIQGLRGKATGLVFPNFSRKQHVVTAEWAKQQMVAGKLKFKKFTCGLDTSYSSKSPDTIAMLFQGITEDRKLITLAEKVYSNKDLSEPLAPSDTAVRFIDFLEKCRKEWGFAKETFIDCADAATITELRKYKRLHGCLYNFIESYKKVEILDRIRLQLGWIQQGCYLVVDTCTEHISELERYSWNEEKDIPEDRNDHTINAQQYGWIPYRNMIGFKEEQNR